MPGTIFFCQADGRLIGLDLMRGRYFARAAAAPVMAGPVRERPSPAAALDLPPPAGRPPGHRRRPGLALVAILVARMAVRVLTFRSLMRLVSRISAPADFLPCERRLSLLVEDYRAVRRYAPFARRCLPDSIAMLLYLWLRDQPAQFVVGVIGHPFSAHCWVQTDAHVLSDIAGAVGRHTPLLSSRCLAAI